MTYFKHCVSHLTYFLAFDILRTTLQIPHTMNGEAQCWLAREWAPCRHPRAKRDLDRRANRAKFRTGAVTQVAPVPQTRRSAETGAGEQ